MTDIRLVTLSLTVDEVEEIASSIGRAHSEFCLIGEPCPCSDLHHKIISFLPADVQKVG